MMYEIRCNPMQLLYGALSGSYVTVRVTRDAPVAQPYTYSIFRCRTSQYQRTLSPLSVSMWHDLVDPAFDGVGLTGFRAGPMLFNLPKLLYLFFILLFFPFSSFYLWVGIVGLGSLD